MADLRRLVAAETPPTEGAAVADGPGGGAYQLMNQSTYPPVALQESEEANAMTLKEAGLVNARVRQRMA